MARALNSGQRYLSTEQVDGHPLDGRHVHESMARLGVGQVGSGQYLWVELLIIPEVFAMEPLAVDLVHLVELQARFRLEGSECPDGLSGQGAAVNQEQDPTADAGLHQAVHLIDHREGLARASRHSQQHQPLALCDGFIDGLVGFDLVRPQAQEPDPGDLMRPFPSRLMRMWPISTPRVNKPEIDDPSIVEPVELAPDAA
jgi:hypothetical protein